MLPTVEQEKLPEDITDDDGNLLNDCAEVRAPSSLLCKSYLLMPQPM